MVVGGVVVVVRVLVVVGLVVVVVVGVVVVVMVGVVVGLVVVVVVGGSGGGVGSLNARKGVSRNAPTRTLPGLRKDVVRIRHSVDVLQARNQPVHLSDT